jgi:hypothetical protein
LPKQWTEYKNVFKMVLQLSNAFQNDNTVIDCN